MILNVAKVFLIVSVILLPDFYVIDSPFRIRTIALALLLLIYLFDHVGKFNKTIQMSAHTRDVFLVAYTLLIYVYISDIIKNDPVEAANLFYPHLLIPIMLLIFEYRHESLDLYKALYVVIGISTLFAFLQIFGIRENLGTLIPEIGPVRSDNIIASVNPMGLRVSGAAYSIVGFAEYLGILIIISYYRLMARKNIILIAGLVVMVILLIFTQTRSALYGLIPSIVLVRLFYARKNIREVVKILVLLIVIFVIINSLFYIFEKGFHRITVPYDLTVLERLQTNYYAVVGVWREAPIFGIPKEMAWDVISNTAAQEERVFDTVLRISTTHHIQVLYYFRYYGLVGVGLLIMLYYMVFRKISRTQSYITKMMLLSIFIFDFQYSFGHNNKLINNIILWVLLSFVAANYFQTPINQAADSQGN